MQGRLSQFVSWMISRAIWLPPKIKAACTFKQSIRFYIYHGNYSWGSEKNLVSSTMFPFSVFICKQQESLYSLWYIKVWFLWFSNKSETLFRPLRLNYRESMDRFLLCCLILLCFSFQQVECQLSFEGIDLTGRRELRKVIQCTIK